MGFWKTFFGGEADPEEEKRNADARNFDLLKYDGVKAMRIGQFDYAAKCFQKALETKDDPEVHDYFSRALIHLGRLDEALRELKTIMRTDPDNVNLMMQAAGVAYMKEDYDEMVSICEQALALDDSHALVHLFYAKAELGQGHLVQGIARLTKAISLDEELADARLLRGQTLYKMGDMGGALTDVKWLLDHVQPQEDVMLLAARVMHAGGNDEVAQNLYNVIIEMNPFHLDAYRERGKIRFDKGDKQGAQEDMQKVLELDPQAAADINGDFSAEGIEERVKKAYSAMNPFGL